MSEEKLTKEAPQKGKRRLLIGVLIGLAVLLVLSLVVWATPLKDLLIKDKDMPEISLELVEEQLQENGSSRFEVEALVAGNPLPEVTFSRDDSGGEAGANRVWILLERGERYTLTAEAENAAGSAAAQIELEADGDLQESSEQDDAGSEESPEQGEAAASKESQKQSGTAGSKGSSQSGATQNFLPIITAIKFNSKQFAAGKTYKATAEAGDPDGDPLTYRWSGDGTFSSTKSNPTNWTAPNKAGKYKIKVTIKDGRGGVATRSKTITVNDPDQAPKLKKTKTLTPVKGGESGWIVKGDYTKTEEGTIYAGDNSNNQMARGCISFDINELAGKEVALAVLRMKNPKIYGNPSAMGSLAIGTAYWGPRPLKVSDYTLSGTGIEWPKTYDVTLTSTPGSSSSKERVLAAELQGAIKKGRDRFQIRFQFSKDKSNGNNIFDGVQYKFGDISLYVEYY